MLVCLCLFFIDDKDVNTRTAVGCIRALFATARVYCSAVDSDCGNCCTAVNFCIFIRLVLLLVHA